jgi:hypothetical protein
MPTLDSALAWLTGVVASLQVGRTSALAWTGSAPAKVHVQTPLTAAYAAKPARRRRSATCPLWTTTTRPCSDTPDARLAPAKQQSELGRSVLSSGVFETPAFGRRGNFALAWPEWSDTGGRDSEDHSLTIRVSHGSSADGRRVAAGVCQPMIFREMVVVASVVAPAVTLTVSGWLPFVTPAGTATRAVN